MRNTILVRTKITSVLIYKERKPIFCFAKRSESSKLLLKPGVRFQIDLDLMKSNGIYDTASLNFNYLSYLPSTGKLHLSRVKAVDQMENVERFQRLLILLMLIRYVSIINKYTVENVKVFNLSYL